MLTLTIPFFSKTTNLTIDRSKTILPVIVFLNPDLSNYERVVRSETLGQVINIFSYADFETMLQTVVLPYDIVFYLQYRLAFEGIDSGRLIFDDVDANTTFVSRLVTEKDYAQMFLTRTYYRAIIKHNLTEEHILYYNDLISQFNVSCKNERSPFMSGFLRVDYETLSFQELSSFCNWSFYCSRMPLGADLQSALFYHYFSRS